MSNRVDVAVVTEWTSPSPELALATFKVVYPQLFLSPELHTKIIGHTIPPYYSAQFLRLNEAALAPRITRRIWEIDENLQSQVVCSSLRPGSLEYLVTVIVGLATAKGVKQFLVDYPKLKQGLREIATDIKTTGSWLVDACAASFDWITLGTVHSPDVQQLTPKELEELRRTEEMRFKARLDEIDRLIKESKKSGL